jgi:hypothetical protein
MWGTRLGAIGAESALAGAARRHRVVCGVIALVTPASAAQDMRKAIATGMRLLAESMSRRAALFILSAVFFGLVLESSGSVVTDTPGFAQVAKGAGSPTAAAGRLESLPVQAQAVVSASLASGDPAFAASRVGSGFRLAGGGVSALLDSRGALAASGGSVVMRLVGVGRPGRMRVFSSSAPVASGNQVDYRGARVAEWFRAGPLGIEQGFGLRIRPGGSGGVVVLRLSLGGSLVAQTASAGLQFVSRSGGVLLRYGGLQVVDASGRALRSSLLLRGRSLLVRLNDEEARYPVTVDPLLQLGPKLVGACTSACTGANGIGERGAGELGYRVALSANGNTALIGAPGDNAGHGAAWVFVRSRGAWAQQGTKLVGDCTSSCVGPNGNGESGRGQFGYGVALSANGKTALIGAPDDNAANGAAWVFVGPGTPGPRPPGAGKGPVKQPVSQLWAQQGRKLVADCSSSCTGANGTGESGPGEFGYSVALSGDGNTALIGALSDKIVAGAAWVFVRSFGRSGIGAWAQQGTKLVGDCASSCSGPNGTGESGPGLFGSSVAVSGDGNTALIGAPYDSARAGAVWVFARSAGAWAQQGQGAAMPPTVQKLVANCTSSCGGPQGIGESGNGWFGYSVALSEDGNVALIGAPHDNADKGAVWEFGRSNGAYWTQLGHRRKLIGDCTSSCSGPNGTGESGPGEFGSSVALSADGNTALIGAPDDNSQSGAAWVFEQFSRNGFWAQRGTKLVEDCTSSCSSPNGSGERGHGALGYSVEQSGNGTTALIGAPKDNDSVGAAFTAMFNPPVIFIGDSVTAGFGYCGTEGGANSANINCRPNESIADRWTGENSLRACAPDEALSPPNDRCSNNNSRGAPWNAGPWFHRPNAPDIAYPYVIAEQQSGALVYDWAVTGSTPADWDPVTRGAFGNQTKTITDSYVVMTLGANPLLAAYLKITTFNFPQVSGSCADTTIINGGLFHASYAARLDGGLDDGPPGVLRCFNEKWESLKQGIHLLNVYKALIANGDHVLVLGYPLGCPWDFGTWQPELRLEGPSHGEPCTSQTLPEYSLIHPSPQISQFDQARALDNDANTKIEAVVREAEASPGGQGKIFFTLPDQSAWANHQAWSSDPWVFKNDTWVHPNAGGHKQLAATVVKAMCGDYHHWCGTPPTW